MHLDINILIPVLGGLWLVLSVFAVLRARLVGRNKDALLHGLSISLVVIVFATMTFALAGS